MKHERLDRCVYRRSSGSIFVQIERAKKIHRLGTFPTLRDAISARDAFEATSKPRRPWRYVIPEEVDWNSRHREQRTLIVIRRAQRKAAGLCADCAQPMEPQMYGSRKLSTCASCRLYRKLAA